jgi:hypothetical protein
MGTATETSVATSTRTPLPNKIQPPVVFPNPVRNGDPGICFSLKNNATWIRWVVFTDAYRKVYTQENRGDFWAGRPIILQLQISGLKPANGLYYLVLQTSSGEKSISKFCVAH